MDGSRVSGVADDGLTRRIIGSAIEVHRTLGPGLLESAYRRCLGRELELRGIPSVGEVKLDLEYKGLKVPSSYRLDLLVADRVIVEVKTVDAVLSVHKAQLLTYLRLSGRRIGLILNFRAPRLVDGITRLIHTPDR